jgi:hypothetical protein
MNFPKKSLTSSHGLWVGFEYPTTLLLKHYIQNDFEGYVVLFHDPFELPSLNSRVLKFNILMRTHILINPQLHSIDESIFEYEPEE